jgi:hypothetical protein
MRFGGGGGGGDMGDPQSLQAQQASQAQMLQHLAQQLGMGSLSPAVLAQLQQQVQ